MPKLSKKSLEKRFYCQYCGVSVRTRQGLSGHIQWKHGKKYEYQDLKIKVAASEVIQLKAMKELQVKYGLPDWTLEDVGDTIAWWTTVRSLCDVFGIKLNQQDLKNYLITSFVQIHQNRRLKQDILDSLGGLNKK